MVKLFFEIGRLFCVAITILTLSLPTAIAAQVMCGNDSDDGPNDYTTTNVQEEGVNEPDLLKTDGQYLYVSSGQRLHIVDAWPPEQAHLLSVLPLPGSGEILLAGCKVVALTTINDLKDGGVPFFWGTRVTVVDISDRSNPALERSFDLEGRLLAARMVDGIVYTATVARSVNSDLGLLTVLGFDPNSDAAPHGVGLLANGWQVYSSRNSLYAVTGGWSEWQDEITETHIHQFQLNGGDPVYAASGRVPGWVLNQFSFSENDGALRVATTDRTRRDGDPNADFDANNVFVLEQQRNELEVAGEARDIAPGESIVASRMTDDRGYLATGSRGDRQKGRLTVISFDPSSPVSPRVTGELRITGFSSYLHPVGDDLLVGIGRADDDLVLQLFDVSDTANPTLLHHFRFSSSGASKVVSAAERAPMRKWHTAERTVN